MVKEETVEQVDKYHYLGLVIDNKLVWHKNTDEIIKEVHSHLFCCRKQIIQSAWEYFAGVFLVYH